MTKVPIARKENTQYEIEAAANEIEEIKVSRL